MEKEVKILFSKCNLIGSKFIIWLTKYRNRTQMCTPSHVALLIGDRIFESTTSHGVKITKFRDWTTYNTTCAEYSLGLIPVSRVIDEFRKVQGKKYDWLGALYLGIWIFLNKLIRVKIPEKNKWENSSRFFCCEVLGYLTNEDYDMSAPVDIMNKFLLRGENE